MEISEEVPLLEKHLVKRRMESKSGEIRRVHIIYFLSRMGQIEHPHLIRVHHVNRAGVRLRDVKRWLADLRGKDMPDSFSWSYKRRYKTGYVWQDLLDDDLITPISDDEYVLKGSEISAFPSADQCASAEKTTTIQITDPVEDKTLQYCTIVKDPESITDLSLHPNETVMKKSEPVKRTVTFNLEPKVLEEEERRLESDPAKGDLKGSGKDCSFDASPSADELKNGKEEKSRRRSFLKTKSPNGTAHLLRNILTCGVVDANESVMKTVNRLSKVNTDTEKKSEILSAEGVDGREMVFSWTWNQQQQQNPHQARKSFYGVKNSRKKSAAVTQKPVLGDCKPIAEPNCSQCGKAFNPEKLHAHMKSCRAMKSRGGKSKPQTSKDELTTEESAPAFLLTHSLHQSFDKINEHALPRSCSMGPFAFTGRGLI